MTTRIAICSAEDLDGLLASDISDRARRHYAERFDWQQRGLAHFLLAWSGDRSIGRATLLTESKYEPVRSRYPGTAEINALEADPQGHGTGTALIRAAERLAAAEGHPRLGLAVEPGNEAARRLSERLGYLGWSHGLVIDEWIGHRADGTEIAHRDPCLYLSKTLGRHPEHAR